VEEIPPPVEYIFSLMESFSGVRGGIIFSHWQWVEEYLGRFKHVIL